MKTKNITQPAYVNDREAAKLFFAEYNIPYEEITEGKDKGTLLVKAMDLDDQYQIHYAQKRLERSRLRVVTDHPNAFLDKDDNVIVTFSPYDIDILPPRRPWLEMSDHSIYGNGTKTFVVRISREEITKQRIKELQTKIDTAEQDLLQKKKQYEAAIEKMHELLEEKALLVNSLPDKPTGSSPKSSKDKPVTPQKWTCTWQGHATWDDGTGTVNCSYRAAMTFQSRKKPLRGKEIRNLEINKPGFTDKDVIKALLDSLRAELDAEFEDYCMEDDYYQPVVEDFEAEYIAKAWAEDRNLNLIAFEGSGTDEGYEPKHRRR